MYNLYKGNTGQVSRVHDDGRDKMRIPSGSTSLTGISRGYYSRGHTGGMGYYSGNAAHGPRPIAGPGPGSIRPPSPLSGLSGELGRLLNRLSPMNLETDDLLLLIVLYLMYRQSGDDELLFIMAAMFLL